MAVTLVDCGSLAQDPLTPLCTGTGQDDEIRGRAAEDTILANGGNDEVYASAADDHVDASAGDDTVYGGPGRDSLAGGPDDGLFGSKNADILTDCPNAYPDRDGLRGGGGNDRLDAFDEDYNDVLVCGPGENDKAVFDFRLFPAAADTVSDTCENQVPGLKVDPR